jgi:hypothetical protein
MMVAAVGGGGTRYVPVPVVERSVPATRSRPTKLPPNPPMDLYEIEAGKRYRRHVARVLGGGTADRFGPPAAPTTRMGIAIAAGQRMAQAHEAHAIAVARKLHLR